MSRYVKVSVFAAVFAAMLSSSALSATLVATAQNTSVSNFSIGFDDRNANGLLENSEVTDFSGVTITNILGDTFALTDLVFVAQVDGVTLNGTDKWLFSNAAIGNYDHASTNWTYQISAVPLPASILFLLAGMGGLVGLRTRPPKAICR